MSEEEQIKIMEGQLSNFDTLLEKMAYMNFAFDPDPEYTLNARNIVRSNAAMKLKGGTE